MTLTAPTAIPCYIFKNEGPFSNAQLERLANARVLVGGLGAYQMGAVGLSQLGVATGPRGRLKIADPEVFERTNANRQVEATVSQTGLSKTLMVARKIQDLVPEVHLEIHPEGITLENLDDLLDDVDLVIDAVDFLRPQVKLALHERARRRNIPVVMGLLLNKGTVVYNFTSSGPSFTEFFAFPADAALASTWNLPGSRIMVHPTVFPDGPGYSLAAGQRHMWDVLTGQHHIASNSIACGAFVMLMNFMATSLLLGDPVPTVPKVAYLDPSTLSMGSADLTPALVGQATSSRTRYAAWYDKVEQSSPAYQAMAAAMAADLNGRVLNVGAGTGVLAEHLVRAGLQVDGIEHNLAMLAHAYARASRLRIEGDGRLRVGEGSPETLCFEDDTFDGYCSNDVILDTDLRTSLGEARRVLRRGGRIAIHASQHPLGADSILDEFLASQQAFITARAVNREKIDELMREAGFCNVVRRATSHGVYVVAEK
ncbi:MAG: ThiF family adenylyltransferase [Candidatus Xenobia bacterium]